MPSNRGSGMDTVERVGDGALLVARASAMAPIAADAAVPLQADEGIAKEGSACGAELLAKAIEGVGPAKSLLSSSKPGGGVKLKNAAQAGCGRQQAALTAGCCKCGRGLLTLDIRHSSCHRAACHTMPVLASCGNAVAQGLMLALSPSSVEA
jgi:hypothetical protein